MREQIIGEFTAGKVVSVLGWQLAVSEARAAAAIKLGA
jgi:hypothetical protein